MQMILVIIDAFSRWVELFPTKSTTAAETDSMINNHVDRFGSPEVIHTDQEVYRHLRALLFDSRVHDKWSFKQLPLVQRIMSAVEKTSTGVTPAELILSHSIRLSSHILTPVHSSISSFDISLSDRLDELISRQHTLLWVAQEHQLQTDQHKVLCIVYSTHGS
jgi:hypothetical protein